MEQIIVCTYQEELISKVAGKAFVIRTSDPDQIPMIHQQVNRMNKLHCILLEYNHKLSGLRAKEEWMYIPITIFASELGSFKDFIPLNKLYQKLSVRIFLSTDSPEVYKNLQILSSLGIDCGLVFGRMPVDWNEVNDLMYYHVYGKIQHGSIEPFEYLLKNYQQKGRTDFNTVYFDQPERYVHMNDLGQIALSRKALDEGTFITDNIENLSVLRTMEGFKEYTQAWQLFFKDTHMCSMCPAWRICLGKFSAQAQTDDGCKTFFTDMMEAIDFHFETKRKKQNKELCQL